MPPRPPNEAQRRQPLRHRSIDRCNEVDFSGHVLRTCPVGNCQAANDDCFHADRLESFLDNRCHLDKPLRLILDLDGGFEFLP